MSAESKQALIPIMHNQYGQILEIEERWGIRFKEGDMRPRIEYFHDAVRALTSESEELYARGGRLSVEHLAYDVSQLRQIQAKPISRLTKATDMSVGDALATQSDIKHSKRSSPNRVVRQELAQLYKDYTVLYVALFVETADINFKARCDEIDEAVQDIGMIEQVLNKLVAGDMTVDQAKHELDQIDHDMLRDKIMQAVSQQLIGQAERDLIMDQLNAFQGQLDQEKAQVETAHLNYVTSQLAVYENSKDTIKRMAAQGMNLAGKFVENALGQGQGQGQMRGI